MKPDLRQRLTQSVETATSLAEGLVGDRRRRRRDATSSARSSPAPSTASRCPSSSRGSSRSTRRTAPARAAPGSARSSRSTPTCSSPTRRSRSARARSSRGRSASSSFYESVIQAIADRYEIDLDDAVARARPRSSRTCFLYGTSGERIYVQYRNRMGRKRSVHAGVRGIVANLERRYRETDSSAAARADRGVHELPAVPRLRRRAAQARGARGHGRRTNRSTSSRSMSVTARARVPRRARADADGGADRRAGSSRRSASG